MGSLAATVRRFVWNEEQPSATEATFSLMVVLSAVVAAGWFVAEEISNAFAELVQALP